MAEQLIKDLINLPEQVNRGDFVPRLTEGVAHPDATVDGYVVTPQLEKCFDTALAPIKSAVEGRTSKAAYLVLPKNSAETIPNNGHVNYIITSPRGNMFFRLQQQQ